ncbi:MAG: hypothetical protein ACI4V1_00705 [Eubacteriales bacterium]
MVRLRPSSSAAREEGRARERTAGAGEDVRRTGVWDARETFGVRATFEVRGACEACGTCGACEACGVRGTCEAEAFGRLTGADELLFGAFCAASDAALGCPGKPGRPEESGRPEWLE